MHLGAHKTATSLVQGFLRKNSRFRRKNDIAFITRGDCNDLIGWGLDAKADHTLLPARLRQEVGSTKGRVILSHENALGRAFTSDHHGPYGNAEKLATNLAAAVADFDVTVIFYIRPLASFVESYYLQTIHEGRHHTFDKWSARCVDLDTISWQPTVDALNSAFGKERVLIGDFNEIKAGQTPFLADFFRRCGFEARSLPDYEAQYNPSVSARGLQMALAVNPYLESIPERRLMRKFLQTNFSNRTEERARPMPDDMRARLAEVDDREYQAILAAQPDPVRR